MNKFLKKMFFNLFTLEQQLEDLLMVNTFSSEEAGRYHADFISMKREQIRMQEELIIEYMEGLQ